MISLGKAVADRGSHQRGENGRGHRSLLSFYEKQTLTSMGASQHSNCPSHRGLDSHDVGGILLVGEMVARTIVAQWVRAIG